MDDEEFNPGRPPRALNDVLAKVLRRMKVSDETTALGVFSHWRDIVGDAIADNVIPKRLEKTSTHRRSRRSCLGNTIEVPRISIAVHIEGARW